MATVSIPFTFTNNSQNADATQVNTNFSTLATFLNTEAIQRDGSVAFTGIPLLPSTTPTLANHATRKGYVDAFFPVTSANIADATIVDADISATAAVAYSKLSLANSLVLGDFASTVKPVVICTSSTRPSSPVAGQLIYETDKDRLYAYNGSSWMYLGGQVGATATGATTVTTAVITNLSFTSKSFDTDNFITVTNSTFTVPISGVYSLTLDVGGSADMGAGYGSKLTLTAGTRSFGCAMWATEHSQTWIVPMTAAQTVKWQVTNGTGVSVTYTCEATLRLIGQ